MDTQNIRLQSSIYVRKLLNKRINKTTEKLNNALQTGNKSKVVAILSRITNKQNIDMDYVTNFMEKYKNGNIKPSDVLKGNEPFFRQLRNGIYDKSKISGQLKEDLKKSLGLESYKIESTNEKIEFNFLDGKYVIYDKDGNQRDVTDKDIAVNLPKQIKRDLEADLNKTSFEKDGKIRNDLGDNANKFLNDFSKINTGDYRNANELLENNPELNKLIPQDKRDSIIVKLNDRFFKALDKTSPNVNRTLKPQLSKETQQNPPPPKPLLLPPQGRNLKPRQSNLSKTESETIYTTVNLQKLSNIPVSKESVIYAEIQNRKNISETQKSNSQSVIQRESIV